MPEGAVRAVVRGVLTSAVVAVGVVGAWWLVIRIFDIQEYVVPPPDAVWTRSSTARRSSGRRSG
ncbi:hypothetical protein AB0K74_10530 [Streptomyces sp. NPDC056159]|uniref:hypothetical protein n=1 Tax=unclassified Streptomyces TaxID=2593676 RepID=UPI00342B9248